MYVDVTVSLTLSKSVEVEVEAPYTDADLRLAVEQQHYLPTEGWYVDEFEVIDESRN